MSTASATIAPESIAAQAVSATSHLLSHSESIRLRSSLLVDLDAPYTLGTMDAPAVSRATDRALRGIRSHRLGYGSRLSNAQAAELEELPLALEGVQL